MSVFTYIAPCHFGLEAVLKREVAKLGLEVLSVDDGRVVFAGNETDAARANIGLRSAERILIRAGSQAAGVEAAGAAGIQTREVHPRAAETGGS